jgi:predicted transposase/invertase (TIGR01784 family)
VAPLKIATKQDLSYNKAMNGKYAPPNENGKMSEPAARKYAKPTVDVIFKKVFGNPNDTRSLESFLSELLGVKVKCLKILNSEPIKDIIDSKGVRLDILAKLNDRTEVNIEVQVRNEGDTQKRSLFYWSKLYSQQLAIGQTYNELRPVIGVFILDHSIFPDVKRYVRKFLLQDSESKAAFFDDEEMLEMHFIELSKFKSTDKIPQRTLDKWILYFNTDSDNVIEELKMSDKNLSIAVSDIEIAAMPPEERRWYEARLAAIRDYDSAMYHSAKKGKAEGAHANQLKILQGFVTKRFPNLLSKYRAKIFMMSDEQLEQQIYMISDYPDQKAFEDAINALKIPDQK